MDRRSISGVRAGSPEGSVKVIEPREQKNKKKQAKKVRSYVLEAVTESIVSTGTVPALGRNYCTGLKRKQEENMYKRTRRTCTSFRQCSTSWVLAEFPSKNIHHS